MSYHLIFDIAERQIGEIRTITNSFVDYQSDQASKTCVERVTRVKKTLFAVKKQENKITEGLRTFQKCVLEKKITIFTSLERSRSHATNTISIRGIS